MELLRFKGILKTVPMTFKKKIVFYLFQMPKMLILLLHSQSSNSEPQIQRPFVLCSEVQSMELFIVYVIVAKEEVKVKKYNGVINWR